MPMRQRRIEVSLVAIMTVTVSDALTITVCQGGACQRNGAVQLLQALQSLSSGEDVTITAAPCCSICPSKDIVVRQGSKQQFVKGRSTLATLLETATAVLTELPGVAPSTSLIEAVRAKFMGDEALRQGQWLAAAEQYDVALGSDEAAAILASPAEHAQPPAAPAPLEWESSVWHETRWQSSLRFDESVTAFEFGVCANEAVKLTGAMIDDELNLRGELETAEGYGTFCIAMTPDGRSFTGVCVLEQGEEEPPWTSDCTSESP
jgi:hypothetical protein